MKIERLELKLALNTFTPFPVSLKNFRKKSSPVQQGCQVFCRRCFFSLHLLNQKVLHPLLTDNIVRVFLIHFI